MAMQSALNVICIKRFSEQRLAELEIDVGVVFALVSMGLSLVGAKYAQWKRKAKQLKTTVDLLVDATEDDNVSEEEFRGIAASVKKLVSPEE